MRGLGKIMIAGLLLAGATAAGAEWTRAETQHFVVYSDDRPDSVRQQAADLEQFDGVLRRFHKTAEQDGATSNKLTVFVVDEIADVQRLCGRCPNVAGFYNGRASGSVAFTPRYTSNEGISDLKPRVVLYHEYAHHFLFGNYALAYPAWFSEGYAEFASTVRRDKQGLTIGAPPQHRAWALLGSEQHISAKQLFAAATGSLSGERADVLYGRGWLLTHYIMFDQDRRAQFGRYLAALNAGKPSVAAATSAFGDLDQLDRQLNRYLNATTIKALTMKPGSIPEPTVTSRPLSPGEAAMMALRQTSARGVDAKSAGPLFRRARPIAAQFPDDAVAQGWFAEMAYDAGELDAADAAADRALARDPRSMQARLYKGLIAVRRATKTKAAGPAWIAARRQLIAANQLDPDAALPLQAYYDSFVAEGRAPTRNAIDGLMRAQELAPQDDGLRFAAAAQSIHDNELDHARRLLKPLVYNPHAGTDTRAAGLLAALEAAPDRAAAEAALARSQQDPPAK